MAMDKNNDGKVTFEEYWNYFKKEMISEERLEDIEFVEDEYKKLFEGLSAGKGYVTLEDMLKTLERDWDLKMI